MNLLLAFLTVFFAGLVSGSEEFANGDLFTDNESINILFWNVENLFDCENSGKGSSEKDFSPQGEKRWTKGRYWKKVGGIAKTLMWTGRCCEGEPPDIVAFAEVENAGVCRAVISGTLLRKIPYKVVHRDSPDRRGIDVALVYREDRFRFENHRVIPVRGEDGNFRTRDILHVSLLHVTSGELYHFIVNHHPSKFSGSRQSKKNRMYAMNVLMGVCDSLAAAGEHNIVAMGDFNDEPDSPAAMFLGKYLDNMAMPLFSKGIGTIRFGGEWSLIDMFFVTTPLSSHCKMSVLAPDFLLTEDRKHSGMKPFRTFSGPSYNGGISDHLPILLKIKSH